MRTGTIHFALACLLLLLIGSVAVLEYASWEADLDIPGSGDGTPQLRAQTIPYYADVRVGNLEFGPVDDGRFERHEPRATDPDGTWSGDPESETEPDWGELDPPGAEPARVWKQFETYEASFHLTWSFPNPYDPDQIAVDAVVTKPSGAVEVVPAFWYIPCRRSQVPRTEPIRNPHEDTLDVEVIAQDGPGRWMLRYTPREEGDFSYRLHARTPDTSAYSDTVRFTVRGRQGHGFVRVSGRDSRYFERDDGSFFFPIGQNVAWTNDLGTTTFARYMANMRANGANWARIWLTSYFRSQLIEWSPKFEYFHGLGFYSAEMAWKLDRMLASAAEKEIYLMWCLQHHGQFLDQSWTCWKTNPYNEKTGGFLERPQEYFTHPRARELFRKRMRYYIARYGHEPHLFAWEFWNEVESTQLFSAPTTTEWHAEMGRFVKALDPTRRLVTTSYRYRFDNDAFALPSHDFAQIHVYHEDPISWTLTYVKEQRERFGKPVLIGEFGIHVQPNYFSAQPDDTGVRPAWPVDPDGLHVHNGLWTGLFSGSAGTAMTWWWDRYIEQNNLYYHFKGIRAYLAGEDLRRWRLRQQTLREERRRTPSLVGHVLVGPDRAYGWLYQTAYTIGDFAPNRVEPQDVKIRLENLNNGPCAVEFWDTYDGVVIGRQAAEVKKGELKFTTPRFTGDLAFKVLREPTTLPVTAETPVHDEMIQKLKALETMYNR
jgi:hypothetical protein